MEFTNEISFDKKLTENEKSKIIYNGFLAQKGSNSLTIVYGFGSNWDCTQAKDMKKIDNGFETEVEIKPYDTFNFCFRNENYEWDNNNTFNYISPIEKQVPISVKNSIKDTENSVNNIATLEVEQKNIVEEKQEISNANVQLSQMENEIADLFDELFSMPDETYENIVEPIVESSSISSTEFNLDELIEDILSPIISTDNSESLLNSLATSIDNTKNNEKIEKQVSDVPTHTQKILVEDILDSNYSNINNFNSNKVELNNVDTLLETLSASNSENSIVEQQTVTEVENEKTFNIEPIENIEELFEPETPVQEKVQKVEPKKTKKKTSDFTIIEDDEPQEPSLLEEVVKEKETSKVEESVALTVVEERECGISVSPRKLNKFYFFKKKVKLAFYKALVSIPKFLQKQFKSTENN